MRALRTTSALGAFALCVAMAAPGNDDSLRISSLAHAAVAEADGARVAVSDGDLVVGAQLEALGQVRIGGATLAKGSKVGVFALSRRAGLVERVDVQLADGHVVRDVAVSTIRRRFRQVAASE